jgi:hypothetical protein
MEKLNKKETSKHLVLFLLISLLHLLLLLMIYKSINYIVLLLAEFVFFLFYSKFSLRILLRIFILSGFIFLINILFNEGKILIGLGFIKITHEGLINGAKRAGLIASTLFFTYNIFHKNKSIIIDNLDYLNKNNIILMSINYFFIFLELINDKTNIKKLLIKIIMIYKNKYTTSKISQHGEKIIGYNFYIYNLCIIILFVAIFIYSYITA